MNKQKGFTLIELLLVLAIIGIISAIAVPALLGQRERAKSKSVISNVDNVGAECVRINDSAKEANRALAAGDVVKAVLALSNYAPTVAKNPYTGGAGYNDGASTTEGIVALVGSSILDSATNRSYSAVVITGYYTVGGVATSTSKVIALD